MPTLQEETLPQRYAREHQDYLKLCGSMTAEQVADIQLQLHNSLAREQALQQRLTAADERADVLEGLLRRAAAFTHDFENPMSLRRDIDAALKPAEGGGDEYRKSCEVAHKSLSMENQRIVAPGQFKCLACGDVHPGSGNLPCPKMSPTA